MRVRDESEWLMWKGKAAGDDYGEAILSFAERWADLMEQRMTTGEALADIANATSHEADLEVISGSMYGSAVVVLSSCWEHGEELRRWHNLDIQIGDEGERANERGEVLDPTRLVSE